MKEQGVEFPVELSDEELDNVAGGGEAQKIINGLDEWAETFMDGE